MPLIQLFNPQICKKNRCPHLWMDETCYGGVDYCKINKRAGYPKEVKNG